MKERKERRLRIKGRGEGNKRNQEKIRTGTGREERKKEVRIKGRGGRKQRNKEEK